MGDARLLEGGYELMEIVCGQRWITTATEVQIAMQYVVIIAPLVNIDVVKR